LPDRVLIVDDEESVRRTVADALTDEGYATLLAADGGAALRAVAAEAPDLVLLDIAMPGRNGIDVLDELRTHWPGIPVVMMSGHGSIETAVRATKLGAYDFLEKPLSYDKLLLCVARAIERTRAAPGEAGNGAAEAMEIIGESPALARLKEQIALAAPTEGWILLTGDNGTGKELVARQIHLRSRRAQGPFIAVNCAAIPEELIESELFGHERGAFTGAVQMKRGRFEMASGGTLFLDEVGDMSLMTQAKILRALQDHRFERVGGVETLEVDVRVIAATNKDLHVEMAEGRFREDLYYRLNVIPFHVPPLRERREDIPLLVDRFLDRFCAENAIPRKGMAEAALGRLCAYRWPGNVRELQNIVERLVLMTPGPSISFDDLPGHIRDSTPVRAPGPLRHARLADARAEFERQFLLEKLRQNGGNISRTAEVVGLARESLSRKLRSLGIEGEKRQDA
jgi:two-component system, NtrC family, nitrogen regulation response regulator NtrX